MSKRRHRQVRKEAEVPTPILIAALERRAQTFAFAHAHRLTAWQAAKRKWGRGARQSWCPVCNMVAIVIPYGSDKACVRYPKNPTITGDAVFEECEGGGK